MCQTSKCQFDSIFFFFLLSGFTLRFQNDTNRNMDVLQMQNKHSSWATFLSHTVNNSEVGMETSTQYMMNPNTSFLTIIFQRCALRADKIIFTVGYFYVSNFERESAEWLITLFQPSCSDGHIEYRFSLVKLCLFKYITLIYFLYENVHWHFIHKCTKHLDFVKKYDLNCWILGGFIFINQQNYLVIMWKK